MDWHDRIVAAARLVEPIRQSDAVLPEDATPEQIVQAIEAGVNMDFGTAITAMKNGARVSRAGWNGKGMWIAYTPGMRAVPATQFWSRQNHAYAEANGGKADVLPCFTMKTADGAILMGWLASQTDMDATDWGIVS